MNHQQGFSFMEILIALFVIITLSLGLLSEQILIKRRQNVMQQQWRDCIDKDNHIERQYFTQS